MNRKALTAWTLAIALILMSGLAVADVPTMDRAGNPIVCPEKVERIVSLAPSITQVLMDLGMTDKLVAVDTYSSGSTGVPKTLPAFDIMAPDMEHIVALSPDLVLVSGMMLVSGENQLSKLPELGICVACIPSSESIEGILKDTLFIGELAGDKERAKALNDELVKAIDTLKAGTDEPVRVYFEIGSTPGLYSFGSETFLNEIVELLGGKNIFSDQKSWLSVSDESVVAADPQIIFTNENWNPDAVASIVSRPGWDVVSAVKNGNVYMIDADSSSQPNHRILLALTQMSEAMGMVRP